MIKNSVIPFKALSGGERVSFDIALANAFGADLIIKEVAELDQGRLALVLERLKDIDAQVVVATCHTPSEIPKEWSVCAL
jgi:DNA repair exonuclease SbcCD ATPase subunit